MLLMLMAVLQTAQLPDTLTLQSALRLGLERRATISAASARVTQARGALQQAGALPNPTARWSYTEDTPRQHATAEQSFDWLLVRGPARGAARAGIESALADSAQAAANTAAEIRNAFFYALGAEAGATQAGLLRNLVDSLLRIADRRLEAGDISRGERDIVALEAARTGLVQSEMREALWSARAELLRAIGYPPGPREPILLGQLDAGLRAGEPDPVATQPASVRLAERDSAAAELHARAVSRGRIPMPSVEAGADWSDPGAPGQALAVVGISLPLPLWQSGGAGAVIATGEAREANARLREVRGTFAAEREAALARVVETAARALALRDTLVPAAGDLRRRATQAYASGATGVLPVLDALRSERELVGEMLRAQLNWQLAVGEWYRLHGRAE
jgi:cobalt-zinc-cadmium efflux system outer membrane protein